MLEYYVAVGGLSTAIGAHQAALNNQKTPFVAVSRAWKESHCWEVRVGPDSRESRSCWGNQPFILCNTDGESEWECSSRDGTYLEKDVIAEELI